jgi:hypothetical protein
MALVDAQNSGTTPAGGSFTAWVFCNGTISR